MCLLTLLLHCTDDVAVPLKVGEYLLAHLPQATLITLTASGHYPHMSALREVAAALQQFMA